MSDGLRAVTTSGSAETTAASSLPAVGGTPVTDIAALAGAGLWVLAVVAGGLSTVERALALAPLVVVPLGIGLAADRGFEGTAGHLLSVAAVTQPVGAAFVLVSLVSTGVTAAVTAAAWLPVTGLMGSAGLVRTRERGL